MNFELPQGMNRRHFLNHLATGAATLPALQFLSHLRANAAEVKRNKKACILMWPNDVSSGQDAMLTKAVNSSVSSRQTNRNQTPLS